MSWAEEYRALYPVAERCTYFDTSYDCGGTLLNRSAAERYFDDWVDAASNNERGGPGRARFFAIADETRELIGKLLGGVPASQIAFTRNTNEGINMLLQGFPFKPGDNIVFHAKDHDSVVMPSISARDTHGIELKVVEGEGRTVSAEELIAGTDEHTRVIVTSHIQPATGYRIDLEKLGAYCKKNGIYLIVDAIQSVGIQTIYAEKWGIDAISGAGYKWLGAINSIGYFYVSERLAKIVRPVFAAAGHYMDYTHDESGWNLYCTDDSKARKFENSSLDNLGIYTLHDGIKKLLEIGIDQISAYVEPLVIKLREGLIERGFNVITPEDPERHCSIVSVLPSDKQSMFEYFRSRNIVLSISAGTYIRFGIAPFNNEEDVQAVLKAAEECPIR